MIIGLRILALIIDCVICFYSIPLFVTATGWLVEYLSNIGSGVQTFLLIPLWFALIVVSPFLYFGVTTGLWGKTPGKFICRLYVVDTDDKRPGLWRGLARETLKILAITFSIGAIIAFFQLYSQGITWYDSICHTQVHFKPYVRSTRTQRKFRKYFKDQQRGL
jgi:uncharacterized RDD family membrane protein YckC